MKRENREQAALMLSVAKGCITRAEASLAKGDWTAAIDNADEAAGYADDASVYARKLLNGHEVSDE